MLPFLCLNLNAFAQSPSHGSGNTPATPYGAILEAKRTFDGFIQDIYDDVNFVVPPHSPWNCGRDFLFLDYVNDQIDFAYGDVTGLTTATIVVKNGSGSTLYTTTQSMTTPFSYSFSAAGEYSVSYYHGTPSTANKPTITGRVSIQPKIEQLWIELNPICASGYPAGQDYILKLKSIPALNTVAHSFRGITSFNATTPVDVATADCQEFRMSTMVINGSGTGSGNTLDIYSTDPPNTHLPANSWVYDAGAYNNSTPPNMEDYYIKYADLASYLTLGHTVKFDINFSVFDGIQTLNRTAHLLITAPTSSSNPNPALSSFDFNTYSISSNQKWTPQSNPLSDLSGKAEPVIKIYHGLSITPGNSLEIQNMEIEFGDQATADVLTTPGSSLGGGTLILNNSKLTTLTGCGIQPYQWQGVRVYGDGTKDQLSYPIGPYGTTYYQGVLNMYSSKISNANWAITNSGPQVNSFADRNGGIINCSNSTFENNLRGVVFGIYPPSGIATRAYSSYFNNCDFTSNVPFIGFIGGWAVRGVNVSGYRFSYTGSAPAAGYNWGVYGWDFGVSVKDLLPWGSITPIHSEFNNLNYGMYMNDVSSSVSASVTNATFYGNKIGVSMNAVPTPIVMGNSFTIPAGTAATNTLGVQINTNSGYSVINNSFGPVTGTGYNTGVDIINTGADPNTVHSNAYNGLWCANLSNFNNRSQNINNPYGLQFMCNANSNNTHDIAGRGKFRSFNGGIVDGMAGNQGSAVKAAGNSFSTAALWNIYNYTSEVLPINYYYANTQAPTTYYGTGLLNGNPNPCSYPDGNGGGNGGGGVGIVIGIGPVRSTARIYHFLNDSDGIMHRDSLYMALADWVSPYSDLTKTDLLIQDGDIANANLTYNAIVATYSLVGMEADEFTIWGRRLEDIRIAQQQDGKTAQELSAAQVQNLEGVADSATMWAQTEARNWLGLYDGRQFVTEMLFPQEGGQQGGGNQRSILTSTTSVPKYSIAPNPVSDLLQVNYEGSVGDDVNFELHDITGKLLMTTKLVGKSGQAMLDTKALVPGIYLYRISDGRSELAHGKLSKN